MRSFSLGKKISAGFGVLLAIMAVVGAMSNSFIHDAALKAGWLVQEYVPEIELSTSAQDHLLELNIAARDFVLTEDPLAKDRVDNALAKPYFRPRQIEGSRRQSAAPDGVEGRRAERFRRARQLP